MKTLNKTSTKTKFILVGNIIGDHYFGQNKEIKSGTKHFRAGSKVYLFPEFGGMGHQRIIVIGLPRKKFKKIKVVIQTNLVKNVRIKKTENPKLIQEIEENFFYKSLNASINEIKELEEFSKLINNSNIEIG